MEHEENEGENEEKMTQEKSNTSWIGSSKGLAALLVFVSHVQFQHLPEGLTFILGRIGVVVFFLISGYLAFASREGRNRRQYLWNRSLRMYPVFWILLVVMFLMTIPKYSFFDLFLNMMLVNSFVGAGTIIAPSWMMPIQIFFFFSYWLVWCPHL